MHILPAIWIALAAVVVAAVTVLMVGWKREPRAKDLGTISEQWMAQHRMHSRDPMR